MVNSKIDPSIFEPKIEKTSDSSWSISLEEDPETGELILPLPDELLALQGWEVGDELTWEFNKDGTAVITKKSP
jgi:hypothetical protein